MVHALTPFAAPLGGLIWQLSPFEVARREV